MPNSIEDQLINPLFKDVTGIDPDDNIAVSKDKINETIANVLNEYGLKTDMSFVEKMAKLKLCQIRRMVNSNWMNSLQNYVMQHSYL